MYIENTVVYNSYFVAVGNTCMNLSYYSLLKTFLIFGLLCNCKAESKLVELNNDNEHTCIDVN